jgi:hypothetical protein
VTSHGWEESIEKGDAKDTGASGLNQFTVGFLSGQGPVRGFYEPANFNIFLAAISVKAGQPVILLHFLSWKYVSGVPTTDQTPLMVPGTITRVNSMVPAGNNVEYDFTVELNGLVQDLVVSPIVVAAATISGISIAAFTASGAYTYPGAFS